MGTSTYLYFYSFKNLSILLAILTLVYSIFALITNVIAAGKSDANEYTIDYLTISLGAKQNNDTDTNRLYYYVSCWLGVVAMLIWVLVFIGIKFA